MCPPIFYVGIVPCAMKKCTTACLGRVAKCYCHHRSRASSSSNNRKCTLKISRSPMGSRTPLVRSRGCYKAVQVQNLCTLSSRNIVHMEEHTLRNHGCQQEMVSQSSWSHNLANHREAPAHVHRIDHTYSTKNHVSNHTTSHHSQGVNHIASCRHHRCNNNVINDHRSDHSYSASNHVYDHVSSLSHNHKCMNLPTHQSKALNDAALSVNHKINHTTSPNNNEINHKPRSQYETCKHSTRAQNQTLKRAASAQNLVSKHTRLQKQCNRTTTSHDSRGNQTISSTNQNINHLAEFQNHAGPSSNTLSHSDRRKLTRHDTGNESCSQEGSHQ